MEIYRANLIIQTGAAHDNEIMDVIEFAGQFWLVPEWLDNAALGVTMPARMISLAPIGHNQLTAGIKYFVIEDPIPRSIFDGSIPEAEARGFVLIDRPPVQFPIPPTLQ
jgi:hypothetical protein